MSIEALKSELRALPIEERRKLMAFLVVLDDEGRHDYASKLAQKIDDPFIQDQPNVLSRLDSPNIDAIVFASSSVETIQNAVRLLLAKVEGKKL